MILIRNKGLKDELGAKIQQNYPPQYITRFGMRSFGFSSKTKFLTYDSHKFLKNTEGGISRFSQA
jgi:hypothetical protein